MGVNIMGKGTKCKGFKGEMAMGFDPEEKTVG
jgi:hypothetical protein